MDKIIQWGMDNPVKLTTAGLAIYHGVCVAIDTLPMPDSSSGKFYRWFFGIANVVAANYSRTKASTGAAGQQPPKGE